MLKFTSLDPQQLKSYADNQTHQFTWLLHNNDSQAKISNLIL